MADDKHNDASQEGNSRPLSAGDETTGIAETAEHAVSTDAGEAGDQQVGRWPSISVANDTQDDAHQDRGWQDQSSTEDLEANRISGTSDDAGSASGEAADHQPLGEQPVPPRSPSRASSALIAAFTGAVAAGLVVGGAWLADWPPSSSAPSSASQVSTAEFGALANRVARVEIDGEQAGRFVARSGRGGARRQLGQIGRILARGIDNVARGAGNRSRPIRQTGGRAEGRIARAAARRRWAI